MARIVWFYGGSIAELWGATPIWQIELLDSELDSLQAELALERRGAAAFPHIGEESARDREVHKLKARVMDGIPFKERRPQAPVPGASDTEKRLAAIERLKAMPGVRVQSKKGGADV